MNNKKLLFLFLSITILNTVYSASDGEFDYELSEINTRKQTTDDFVKSASRAFSSLSLWRRNSILF